MISNKISDRITKVSNILQQNNLEAVTNEHDKEIRKERYISRRKTEIIDDRRLNNNVIMEYQQIINVLDNTPNQLSKFRTKNLVEINEHEQPN